ncbi:carboxyl transferase domain-containing protein, partial [Acinetobacter baumannii]|uniref:carboxyl transferase domain-containing protein n=1 Tax=Acinetobacter baumannii TaxID=470 RepID=UPI001D77D5AC
GTSRMFITGPQVIKTVTGEDVSQEELGGADTHNRVSGVAHFKDKSEQDCIMRIRKLLSYLPSNNLENPPAYQSNDDINRIEEKLNDLVPDNPNKPYDMKEIIKLLADDNEFFEIQEYYAQNIITGYI